MSRKSQKTSSAKKSPGPQQDPPIVVKGGSWEVTFPQFGKSVSYPVAAMRFTSIQVCRADGAIIATLPFPDGKFTINFF